MYRSLKYTFFFYQEEKKIKQKIINVLYLEVLFCNSTFRVAL